MLRLNAAFSSGTQEILPFASHSMDVVVPAEVIPKILQIVKASRSNLNTIQWHEKAWSN
jgi:hypothetical protein